MNDRYPQEEFNAIIFVRTAIILSGLGLRPDRDGLVDLMISVAENTQGEEDVPAIKRDWNLYKLEVDNPCPIHRLMMPYWLVRGVLDATKHPDANTYPFAEIDPEAWLKDLPEVLDWFPEIFADTATRLLASRIINAAKACPPENLEAIREALKLKGEAIKNDTPCPDDQTEGRTTIVITAM